MQSKLIITRKENNLYQKDVAKVLNLTPESYSMKERGRIQFKANEMFVLSEFFNKKIEELFLPSDFGDTDIRGGGVNEGDLTN